MSSYTQTRSGTVSATDTRVAHVLRQVRVEFVNAYAAGLMAYESVDHWIEQLRTMLLLDALVYFECRVSRGTTLWRAWRYTISQDGSLVESSLGGGIDFFSAPSGSKACVVIGRRPDLRPEINAQIDRMGWTSRVDALAGDGERQRAYSKDGYGAIRAEFRGAA